MRMRSARPIPACGPDLRPGARRRGPERPARPMKVKVTAEQANLREKPDIGSSIVQQIPEGTVLEADRKEGEWYFVRYTLEDGGVIGGWIHESLVEVVETGGRRTEPAKKPAEDTPPRERSRRPVRIGRIEPPEFRTGSIPLEFSVSAGVATLAPRDLNDGTRGFADIGADLRTSRPRPRRRPALRGPRRVRALLPGFALAVARPGRRLFPRRQRGRDRSHGRALSGDVSTKPSVRGGPGQGRRPLLSRRRLLHPRRPRPLFRQGRLPFPA